MYLQIHQQCICKYISNVSANTSAMYLQIHQQCICKYISNVSANTSAMYLQIHQQCICKYISNVSANTSAMYLPSIARMHQQYIYNQRYIYGYGVATVSRIDKIICLFCRIASLLQSSFAKETYNFIDQRYIYG